MDLTREELIAMVEAGNLVMSFEISALVILVWDWLLTLDTEIRLVWRSQWTLGKLLFFLTRYQPFPELIFIISYLHSMTHGDDSEDCPIAYAFAVWLAAVGVETAQSILVLRTWALSGRNAWLLGCLLAAQTGLGVYASISLARYLDSVVWAGSALAEIRGCNIAFMDRSLLTGPYAGIMGFETFILLVTLGHTIWRDGYYRTSRLVQVIYRDGLIFYLLIIFVTGLNLVIGMTSVQAAHASIVGTFQRVMHSVATARILLHIRQYADKDLRPTINSTESVDLTDFHFVVSTTGVPSDSSQGTSGNVTRHAGNLSRSLGLGDDAVAEWFGNTSEHDVEE